MMRVTFNVVKNRTKAASEGTWSADDSRVTLAIPQLVPPLHQRKRQKQTSQNKQELREDHTSTERRLFIGRKGQPRNHQCW